MSRKNAPPPLRHGFDFTSFFRSAFITAIVLSCAAGVVYFCALAQENTRAIGFGDSGDALYFTNADGLITARIFGNSYNINLSFIPPAAETVSEAAACVFAPIIRILLFLT